MTFYRISSNFVILQISLKPQAKTNAITRISEDCLCISLKAKPVDGAANHELIKFLASHFKLRQKDIVLLRGEKDRKKSIQIIASQSLLNHLITLEKQLNPSATE